MAKAKTTTKETTKKGANTMAKKSTKVAETITEVKEVVTEVTTNEKKENKFVSIADITELYVSSGIKCKNPTAKGNYRIMGSLSSLNLKTQKGYYIYSTDEDYELVKNAGLKCEDLVVEQGTNSQDKTRPNTIICTALETLKEVLKIYATNPRNAIVNTEA